MKKLLLNLISALALVNSIWPQTQPKPAPSPTPQTSAPATTPGPFPADYYRNLRGVCVQNAVSSARSLTLDKRIHERGN